MIQYQSDEQYLTVLKATILVNELEATLSAIGATALTVCPRCRVDDFCHVEGCELHKKAQSVVLANLGDNTE